MKAEHEFRDPIHGFIHMSDAERQVVDSPPFQRLRHIRQLALSSLVYPGATHTRFEHSIGVMELAGRVFDVVTREENLRHLTPVMRDRIDKGLAEKEDWRECLRFAALCHDLGHMPFSHAGEALLPSGWHSHESASVILTTNFDGLGRVWNKMDPRPPSGELIAKIAVGPDSNIWEPLGRPAPKPDDWEIILSQIITGDAFGVDRMDYLLRDAHYTGVPNGVFDHLHLIEALRILPGNKKDPSLFPKDAPLSLGLVRSGLHSAEALMTARYFMYQQVYYHRTRKIYDYHLQQFLEKSLPGGKFPDPSKDLAGFLQYTDAKIWPEINQAAQDKDLPEHEAARRIVERDHFKLAHWKGPKEKNHGDLVARAKKEFGEELLYAKAVGKKKPSNFLVLDKNGEVCSSENISDFPENGIQPSFGYVFADSSIHPVVEKWFKNNAG